MLGIFKQALAQAPQELHCPNNPNPPPLNNSSKVVNHGNKAKLLPTEILQHFQSCHGGNAFSVRFDDNGALIAFAPQERSLTATQRYVASTVHHHPTYLYPICLLKMVSTDNDKNRLFCGLGDIYCIFSGSLNNLCSLIRQYGLSKGGTSEAMLVVEAYRTLRDRGPYPADQVLKDLDGDYGFLIYDTKTRTVFAAAASVNILRLFILFLIIIVDLSLI